MKITVISPIKIKRGLRVEYFADHHDCSSMTSFDIRFVLPSENKIGAGYLKVIKDMFYNYLKRTKYKDRIIHVGEIDGTGIGVNISGYVSKEDSLELIKTICNQFLEIKTIIVDPKAYPNPHEGIAYFNGAKTTIREWLKDVVENNMYEYTETEI